MGIWQKLFGLGNGTSYFLDDDDAKTFGDIDYMRKEITVERTYPKGKAEDVPIDKYVPPALNKGKKNRAQSSSSVPYKPQSQNYTPPTSTSSFAPQSQSFAPQTPVQPPAAPAAEAPQSPDQETPAPSFSPPEPKKSSGDGSMDMFRNMAKKIRR